MESYGILALGVLCAAIGGELFVRGVVGVARWACIPAGIIATTIAAFATSSPELAVAVSAALAGTPNIALGDALGSNISNIALILAIAIMISGIHAPRDSIKRDFPVAVLAPLITGMLIIDGTMSRLDGGVLLGLFVIWLSAVVVEARRQQSVADEVLGEQRAWLAALFCAAGLVFLIAAGRLIVTSAKTIALSWGLDNFVVGATVVALATSTPELATTIISKLRGHDEVGLGTILGSNIFNNFFIVGVATVLQPFAITVNEVVIGLAFGLLTMAVTFPRRSGRIERRRGILLLALFVVYLTTILQLR